MSVQRRVVLGLSCVAFVWGLRAQDPLWTRARERVLHIPPMVASEVTSHIDIVDGDGHPLETVDVVRRLSGWKDGDPVRTVVSQRSTRQTGLSELAFEVGIADHPDRTLFDSTMVQRLETVQQEGRRVGVFSLKGKRGKLAFTGKAWIDEASGFPLRVDYTLDTTSIPFTKTLSYSVLFGAPVESLCLPRQVSLDTSMWVLFQHIRISVQQRFEQWAPRP